MNKTLAQMKEPIKDVVLKMDHEQMADFYTACLEINKFAEAMKYRFAQKVLEGKKGWDNSTAEIDIIIENSAIVLTESPTNDVDIANWAFVHWFNRTKELDETMVDHLKHLVHQTQKAVDQVILETPTGGDRDKLTNLNISLLNLIQDEESNSTDSSRQ